MTLEMQQCGSCREHLPLTDYSPSYRGKRGTWCRRCFADYAARRPQNRKPPPPQECTWCGEQYVPRQLKAKASFCSRTCKDRHKNWVLAGERLASKPTDRFCLHCGVTLPQSKRADAVFCSAECNMAAHRLQRSLRRRTGEGMTSWLRAEVFKRDGWKCGICEARVDPDLRFPDPMAPSLDHVIPIAEGGSNEAANLRLTHLRCNCSRKHLGGNEQLAII
jgi:hypothetical protein